MTEKLVTLSKYTLRVLSPNEVEEKHIAAWSKVEARAIEANAFLSPYFVIPAIRYLEKDKHPLILFVEKNNTGFSDLVGVAIFNTHKPTRKFPLPHLSLFSSIHSYLSGFLVDREYASEVTEEIYRFIKDPKRGWHGLRVRNMTADGNFAAVRQAVESALKIKWQASRSWQRPVFNPKGVTTTSAGSTHSNILKHNQRRLRRLNELGNLAWCVYYGESLQTSHLEELLRLEHTGWKKDEGTSLLSNSDHATFFRQMWTGFQEEERIFITELQLNGKVLSTASNLISSDTSFGFKLGWDTEYARYSPSVINVTNYNSNYEALPPNLNVLDSSAAPGSYMDGI